MSNPEFEELKRAITQQHFEQLQHVKLRLEPVPSKAPIGGALYEDLVKWTAASQTQIKTGINNKVYGGPVGPQSPLDFNNAFMAFMESTAVGLRDTSLVIEAVNRYHSSKGNDEEAFRLMEKSIAQIRELAGMWGMDFMQICDLVNHHPDPNEGPIGLVGPFCGLFFPKNYESSDKPFMGITFKGTGTIGEVINDFWAITTVKVPVAGRLWQSEVAKGFYYPLFSTYSESASVGMPFELILKAVQKVAKCLKEIGMIHVTGHSLGGAYATLTYAQLCIQGFGTDKAALGDLYTFGSPRVAFEDFAVQLEAAVHTASNGSSWRITNHNDFVPKIPFSIFREPYIHVDEASMIYPNSKPVKQPTEIGTRPGLAVPTALEPHSTAEYYKSLVYATTGKPSTADLAIPQWEGHLQADFHNEASFKNQAEVSCKFRNSRGFIVGTIAHGSFAGEITVIGSFAIPEMEGKAYIYFNSWEDLYRKENNCVFERKSDDFLTLKFILDNDVPVAFVTIPVPVQYTGEVSLTGGTCSWTFSATDKIATIDKYLTEAFDKATAELFTT